MKRKKNYLVIMILSVLLAAGIILAGQAQKPEPADLVLVGGKIVTVDEAKPQAEALAVRGDRIVAVGTAKEIKNYIGDKTEVIDLQGKLAVPGLIDSHVHFMGIGQAKQSLDLTRARNWDEIVAMVKEAAGQAKPGAWITGRGWHQDKWDKTPEPNIGGLPYHHSLSRVSPDNPVILEHASGHSTIANAKAMELAKITRKTPNPQGGEIIKNKEGEPIGTFLETAQGFVYRAHEAALNRRTAEQVEADSRLTASLASQECLSKGLTSVHDAGASFATIDLYKKLADEGRLGVRINAMIGEGNQQLQERIKDYFITGYSNHQVTVRSIKRFIDGALGSHGAWLLEPYTDLPSSTGLNTEPLADLRETARIAVDNGFQLCVHAIGDRANRETLNIYNEAFQAHPDKKDLRWRIEHAQHLSAADILRFGAMGVIASMQGVHATSDGPWVPKRLGEQRAEEGAYVWRKLVASGALIANGTDAPVEDVDPIPCFYALVTRKMKNGQVFFGDQRLSRLEALRAYTLNGAYASFEEGVKGSLAPGKLADITVLSQDIMTVPEEDILKAQVVYTIVGGKIPYKQADVGTLDSVLKALYESLSFPEGKGPDWERFQNLFASASAPCVRTTPGAILVTDLDGFLANFGGRVKSGALKSFTEEEISRSTESFGNIAQVFSTYRKGMNTTDPQKLVRGINSLQVFFKDGRWWIASLMWQDETPDCPIPPKYLK